MPRYHNEDYDIEKAFRAIEDELIASMMRNINNHRAEETKEGFNWEQWQVKQLESLEKYKRANKLKFSGTFSNINSLIETMIRDARSEGGMSQEIKILKAMQRGYRPNVIPNHIQQFFNKYSNKNLKEIIELVLKKNVQATTTGEFFNLNTRKLEALIKATTNDLTKAEHAMLRMADDKYRKIIFNAEVYANTGAGTYEKAVDMATKDFLSAGINCIEYKNGSRHTVEDYADMAIRTATKRAYLTGEGEKRKEWGISTVIMNKRGNPCPKCLPFCGKVLIDDVWSGGSREDGNYPLMSRAIELGLYHPRCKDSHTTYFEGISSPAEPYTKEEIEKIGADYQHKQEKSVAENNVHKFGRLAKYSLDEDNKKKYRALAAKWKYHITEADILKISGYKTAQFENTYNKELSLIPKRHVELIDEELQKIEVDLAGNSRYDRKNGIMYLSSNIESGEVIHEMAHVLETKLDVWNDDRFIKALKDTLGEDNQLFYVINDDNTFVKSVQRLDRMDVLLSEYQGRVYEEAGVMNENWEFNYYSLGDFFSEAYKFYVLKPDTLKSKQPLVYNYIEGLIK